MFTIKMQKVKREKKTLCFEQMKLVNNYLTFP